MLVFFYLLIFFNYFEFLDNLFLEDSFSSDSELSDDNYEIELLFLYYFLSENSDALFCRTCLTF